MFFKKHKSNSRELGLGFPPLIPPCRQLKPIKEIVFIDSKVSIRARDFIEFAGINKFIKEIKPFYDNNGAPHLYNLIGDDGNVVASIQSNNIIIKY